MISYEVAKRLSIEGGGKMNEGMKYFSLNNLYLWVSSKFRWSLINVQSNACLVMS